MRHNVVRNLRIELLAGIVAAVATLGLATQPAEAAAPWQGVVYTTQLNVRSAPSASAPIVDVMQRGEPVTVLGWVSGDEVEPTNNTWAQLGEGQYVYSSLIHRSLPDAPPPVPDGVQYRGKWIDVNVTQQVLTAYVGDNPVHMAVVSSGRPDYPTPQGNFTILRRVFNETMTNAGLSWIRDQYLLKDVLFTQYFTELGAALHLAYWKAEDSFGIPTSHGCVGLPYQEAEWLWNWADVGVPVYVHQ